MINFRSLSLNWTCFEVSCNFDSQNAMVTRNFVEPDSNDTSVSLVEDGNWVNQFNYEVNLPNDGYIYWVIPIDPKFSVFSPVGGSSQNYHCYCSNGKGCNVVNYDVSTKKFSCEQTGDCKGCCLMEVTTIDDDNNPIVVSTGVIVLRSNTVTVDGITYSK